MESLRILLSASLNIGKSVGDINAAIKSLQNHPSLQKIKIKLDIDTSTLSSFISAVNRMKKISDEQSKIVSETQEVYKKLDGTITTVTQKIAKNGEIIIKTKTLHDENKKAMQDESVAAQKLAKAIEDQNKAELDSITVLKNRANAVKGFKVVSSEGYSTTTQRLEADGETLVSSSTKTNYKKERQDEIKAQEEALKTREKILQEEQKIRISLEKSTQKEREKTKQLEHQLELYKKQAAVNVQNTQRRFGDSIDANALNEYLKSVNKLSVDTPNLRKEMDNLSMSFKEISANANTSGSHVMRMGEQFKTAASRIPLWMIAMTAFYAPLRGLQTAIDTIIQLDKQMVELKRVMDEDTNFDDMLQTSIHLSNELGRSITQVNEAMIGFARQGFNEEQIAALTKVAVLATNISELKADEATNVLTSAMTVFNIEAEKSIHIINALNEVDNNFAVTTKDLAISLQKAGASAKTFGGVSQAA